MIDLIFNWIASPTLPWILALSLLVLAVLGLVWLTARVSIPTQFQLNRLRKRLAKIDTAADLVSARSEMLDLASGLSIVGPKWRAFDASLSHSNDTHDQLAYTVSPRSVFISETLLIRRMNLRLSRAFPGFLVATGMIFTFLGLIAALNFASTGVVAEDIAEAQAALRDLLSSATFKFITSVAGLFGSVIYAYGEKRQLDRVDRAVSALNDEIERLTIPMSASNGAAGNGLELRRLTGMLAAIFGADISAKDGSVRTDSARMYDMLAGTMFEKLAMVSADASENLRHMEETVKRDTKDIARLIGQLDAAGVRYTDGQGGDGAYLARAALDSLGDISREIDQLGGGFRTISAASNQMIEKTRRGDKPDAAQVEALEQILVRFSNDARETQRRMQEAFARSRSMMSTSRSTGN